MATLNDANAIFDFADQLARISGELQRFRMTSKPPLKPKKQKELEALEKELNKATAQVMAAGIAKLGELTAAARTEVQEATTQAEAFLKKIEQVEKVVGVVTAVLGLALTITTGGGASAILGAARGVKTALASGPGEAKA